MDEKMKAAFDAWGVERSKKIATLGVPTPYEYAEWTLDYLRSQQEPVAAEGYDMIDRFLRNNLHDEDYAEYSAALDACYAHPIPSAPAVPEGWKLVPVEPTKAMVDAACEKHGYPCGDRYIYAKGYRSMLAAAPSPEKKENPHD